MSFWSKMSILKVCILFALMAHCSSTNECSFAVDPLEMKLDFGSLNTFYRIAKSLSYGLQKPLPSTSIMKLKEALNSSELNSTRIEVIKEVVSDQVLGLSVFVGFGIAVAVLLFLLGMVVLGMQCCCCLKKTECTSGVVGWKALIYLAILTASISFILAGVIIHNRSSAHTFLAIDNLQQHISRALRHLQLTIKSGVGSAFCAMDNLLQSEITTVISKTRELLRVFLNDLKQMSGIFDFDKLNGQLSAMKNRISVCHQDIADLLQSIEALRLTKIVNDKACNQQLTLTKTILGDLHKNLQSLEQRALSTSNTLDQALNEMNTELNGTTQSVIAATQNVVEEWESMQLKINKTMTDTVLDPIDKLNMEIEEFLKKVQLSRAYALTKASLNSLISVPGTLTLIFASLTALLLFFIVFGKESALGERSQSTIEKFSSILPMLGFYVTVFLVWIVIGLSCFEYVGSWSMSTICRPLFEDPTFSIYSSLSGTVDLAEEYSVNFTVDHLLQRCRDNQTIFIAVNGNAVLYMRSLIKHHGIPPFKDKLAATVNSLKQQATTYMQELTKNQERLKDYLTSSLDLRKDITSTVLSECVRVDSDETRKAVQHLESLNGSLKGLSSDIKDIDNSLAVVSSLKNEVIEKITNLHTRASDLIEMVLINANDQYTHGLKTNIFPCRSLYDVYEYAGFVLCKAISDPAQGMWAAAVMAWLWFVPAAFVMFMRANRKPICCGSSSSTENVKATQKGSKEYNSSTSTSL